VAGHADDVARYYDANTRAFLTRGEGGKARVLHRAVWAEGVSDLAAALHFAHDLILLEIEATRSERPRVLDLGCGVGASLLYLLERREVEGFGITLSREQYEIARRSQGVLFSNGDFCRDSLPPSIDVAYGIESFVHASDAPLFFENVSRSLAPGGRLILVDDFLANRAFEGSSLRDFIWGWHAPSLMTTNEADRLAASAGLSLASDRDLTPHLALDRPRDRALAALAPLLRALLPDVPRVRALVGGDALRKCLKLRRIEYRFRVYRKSNP
jgi:cyclopropane fatty-acyl-phospholipid synthase-like methyltransferase